MPDQIPLASILSLDPFEAAAARQREAVRPTFGRQHGMASDIAAGMVPGMAHGLMTLPERAMHAAGDLQRTGDVYDPAPGLQTAMMMVGTPGVPTGALGSSIGRGRGELGAMGEKSLAEGAAGLNPTAHAERLTQALRDPNPEKFQAEFEILKTMSPEEVKAVAGAFNDRSFSSKPEALKRTWQRFEQMQQVRMKKEFVAGRSAG